MNGRYAHVAARFFATPLLIEPGKARVLLAVVGPRLGLDEQIIEPAMFADDDERRIQPKSRRPYAISDGGIAQIGITGTLVNRASGMDAMSGLSSYSQIANEVLMAAEDSLVSGILLQVDSFGGEVAGAFTCADAIRYAASLKPLWAAVDDNAMSAGYLLASAANKVFVSKTSGVGSVGVIVVHMDQSQLDKKIGVKYTAIIAGDHKADGNPHEPLPTEVRDRIQGEIDSTRDLFVSYVADARDMTERGVRATEAGIYFGSNAVDIGFADGVMNVREVMAAFEQKVGSTLTGSAVAARAEHSEELQMEHKNEKTATTAGTPAVAAPATETPALVANTTTAPVAPPAPAPAVASPAPAPAATAPVVPIRAAALDLEGTATSLNVDGMIQNARAEGYAQAFEVVGLCALAKRPDLAYSLLERKATPADARKVLMDANADDSEPVVHTRVTNVTAPLAQPAKGNAEAKIEALAKQKAAAQGISYHAAYSEVLRENPKLYTEYCEAR